MSFSEGGGVSEATTGEGRRQSHLGHHPVFDELRSAMLKPGARTEKGLQAQMPPLQTGESGLGPSSVCSPTLALFV